MSRTLWVAASVALLAAYVLLSLGMLLAGLGTGSKRGVVLLGIAALLPLLTSVAVAPEGSEVLAPPLLALTPFAGILAAAALWPLGRPASAVLFGSGVASTAVMVDTVLLAPLLTLGYHSHDTNPGTWLPSAIGCLASVVALRRFGPAPALAAPSMTP